MYNAFECSIDRRNNLFKLHSLKYPPNMLALCWNSTPAYYAGIFDTRLAMCNYVSFAQIKVSLVSA